MLSRIRSILFWLAPHERPVVSLYAGYSRPHLPLVVPVLGPEERDQIVLLHHDPLFEESETDPAVEQEADRVDQQNLKSENLVMT